MGYKVQGQAELDGATQMQRLKNQIRKTQEQEELERQREKGHIKESVNTQGKGEMIEKKKAASDDRGVLLKDK